MPKRKRSDPLDSTSGSSNSANKPLALQNKFCIQRITAAQKPLVAALRLGAGFERQKHGRRKKTAQAKNDAKSIARLDAEYAVLKGLDMVKVADQHLRRTIGRIKSLKEHDALSEYSGGITKSDNDSATLNVLARLYKVLAVKKVVDGVIEDLKSLLGAGQMAQTSKTGTEAKAKAQKEQSKFVGSSVEAEQDEDAFAAFDTRIAAPSSVDEESEASISEDDRPPSVVDSEDEHDPENDLEINTNLDDRYSSMSDVCDSRSSIHDDIRIQHASVDTANSKDPSDRTSPDLQSKNSKKQNLSFAGVLPELSHAAYLSGSDSEASDLDTDFKPRKNRRGQRARQKIAELKFGAKAKHLEKQERKKGWDPRRGAVGDDRSRRGGFAGNTRNGRPSLEMKVGFGPQQSGENMTPLGQRKRRDDAGTLHPSWQAAKLAKEKKQLKIDLRQKPVGNKVVFD